MQCQPLISWKGVGAICPPLATAEFSLPQLAVEGLSTPTLLPSKSLCALQGLQSQQRGACGYLQLM